MSRKVVAIAGGALLSFAVILHSQKSATTPSNVPVLHIKHMMSASDFAATGLAKLSDSEIESLDKWLTAFTVRVLAHKHAAAESKAEGGVIESEIEGDFEGWSGETIFKLTNGQIWQQAEYDYMYEYEYRPKVLIYKTATCFKMKVEGADDAICVKRLK